MTSSDSTKEKGFQVPALTPKGQEPVSDCSDRGEATKTRSEKTYVGIEAGASTPKVEKQNERESPSSEEKLTSLPTAELAGEGTGGRTRDPLTRLSEEKLKR